MVRRTKKVYAHAYVKFYDILSEEFFTKYVKDRPMPGKPGDRSMWERATFYTDKKPNYWSVKLFGLRSPESFYRKKLEALKIGYCKLQFASFIKALEFIGYKLELDNQTIQRLSEEEICDRLFEQFTIKYNLATEPSVEEKSFAVTDTVKKFYSGISSKQDLKASWDTLSPEFQKEWSGGYEEFEKGFTNTKAIRNLCIFNVSYVSTSEVECLVYYEDEIQAYSSLELSSLKSLLVRDTDKLISHFNEMRSRAKDLDISNFEDIEIYKFFDPVPSEYIWFKCQFIEPQFKFFSNKRTEVVRRLYQCCCILKEKKWYIYRVRMLPTYSSR